MLLAARVIQLKAPNRTASNANHAKEVDSGGRRPIKTRGREFFCPVGRWSAVGGGKRESRARMDVGKQRKSHCKCYGDIGYNSRTCKKDAVETDN